MAAKRSESAPVATSGYLGLARKWRPARFEDLVGQDAVAHSLARALEGNRLVQGHLLAGPRGVGKTTSARILARAVNCAKGPTATPCGECRHCIDIAAGNDLDVIEIDAASNTGVDNMRELLEGTVRSPFSARFKVYIIDEVHMLSMGAFNALLKTLEEPPSHVIFIFATTELEKIPETIRSRCIVHRFRRLASEDIVRRLGEVAEGEGLKLPPGDAQEIYSLIAQAVDGGMRDALVAFDQLISLTGGAPTVDAARDLLGLSSQALLSRTLEAVADGDAAALLEVIEGLVSQGRSLERFVKGLIGYVRTVMVMQAVPGQTPHAMSGETLEHTRRLAERLSQITVFNLMNQLLELEERIKQSAQPRFLVEFAFLRIVAIRPVLPIEQIIDRIQALPSTGGASPGPAPQDSPAPRRAVAETATPPLPAAGRSYHREEESVPELRESPRDARPSPAMSTRPAAAFAAATPVLHDSGTSVASAGAMAPPAESPPAIEGGGVLAEASLNALAREELIDLIVPVLPETHQFLGRYLKGSLGLRVSGGTLWIQWPRNDNVGSGMLSRPENRQALERALHHIAGRPMRVESAFSDQEAEKPVRAAVSSPPASAAQAAFSDSRPAWETDEIPADARISESGDLMDSANGEDASKSGAPVHTLPRVTAAETRTLLTQNEEFARRARMVRDFFEGTFVDYDGRPVAL